MKKDFFLLILMCLFATHCLAQRKAVETTEVEEPKAFDVDEYKGWQKINLNRLSLYAPKDFNGGRQKSIDTAFWKYENAESELHIFSGLYAPAPSYSEKNSPNYHQEIWEMDEAFGQTYVRVWSYKDEKNNFKFVNAARFTFNDLKGEAVTIFLVSKNQKDNEIAEKIFRSVKFDPNRQN